MEHIPEFIGNHLILVSLTVAVLALLTWNVYGDLVSGVRSVVPAEVTRLINRDDAAVLDIRKVSEYDSGHIINAVNIPAEELEARGKDLEKLRDRPLILCCTTGATAVRIARTLQQNGFEKVFSLKGGIQAWRGANLPLTRDQ